MKPLIKASFMAILVFAYLISFAQAPGNFNYQAVIRDASGNAVPNQAVTLVLKLYNNNVSNPPVLYEEGFSTTTNANGVVNLVIGTNPSQGFNLSTVNWSTGPFYVEIDLNGTPISSTLAQLVSVPYALYANKADTAIVVTNGGVPSGSIMAWGGTVVPTGWYLCDGSAISRTSNAVLFAAIGVNFGTGDGSSTFNLPDLRGQFLRGVDTRTAGSNDPDNA